jgi:hypothetical protein
LSPVRRDERGGYLERIKLKSTSARKKDYIPKANVTSDVTIIPTREWQKWSTNNRMA